MWNQFYGGATNLQNQQVGNSVRLNPTVWVPSGNQWYAFNIVMTVTSTRVTDLWSTVLSGMGGQQAVLNIFTAALDWSITNNLASATYSVGNEAGQIDPNNPTQLIYLLLVLIRIEISPITGPYNGQ